MLRAEVVWYGDAVSRTPSLSQVFIANLGDDARSSIDEDADWASLLEPLVERGRGSWPEIALDREAFVIHLARHVTGDARAWLGRARIDDLYLACALTQGDPSAVGAFEHAYMRDVRVLLDRLLSSRGLAEEVAQSVRQQLLVTSERGPGAIATYGGQGRLRGWLRVIVVREALRVRRRAGVEVPSDDDVLAAAGTGSVDPELRYMKELYRAEFRAAFGDAMAALTARERTLLRYALLDGLTVDQIATVYRVHRATAARWVVGARDRVIKGTRRALSERLSVAAPEQESIYRLIESQLDLSIRTYLRDEAS